MFPPPFLLFQSPGRMFLYSLFSSWFSSFYSPSLIKLICQEIVRKLTVFSFPLLFLSRCKCVWAHTQDACFSAQREPLSKRDYSTQADFKILAWSREGSSSNSLEAAHQLQRHTTCLKQDWQLRLDKPGASFIFFILILLVLKWRISKIMKC